MKDKLKDRLWIALIGVAIVGLESLIDILRGLST